MIKKKSTLFYHRDKKGGIPTIDNHFKRLSNNYKMKLYKWKMLRKTWK